MYVSWRNRSVDESVANFISIVTLKVNTSPIEHLLYNAPISGTTVSGFIGSVKAKL